MRLLVTTDRHEVAFDDEDVRRLEHGIAKEAVRRLCQTVITQLLFERWDPLDAGDRHEHREVEMELRNLRDERLEEVRDFFRVDSNREVVDHIVADVLLDLAQVIETCREHVVVGDKKECVVRVLELHPVRERADVVPDMQRPSRSIAREDALPRLLRGRRRCIYGRCLRAHGRCDGTGRLRASSFATSSPTSSRLPTKK